MTDAGTGNIAYIQTETLPTFRARSCFPRRRFARRRRSGTAICWRAARPLRSSRMAVIAQGRMLRKGGGLRQADGLRRCEVEGAPSCCKRRGPFPPEIP